MPGIVGLISRRPPDECQRIVEKMLCCMQHERFYTSGTYSAPALGVFAGWLTHKGSFADCQPVLGPRGDVALLFSGECLADPETPVGIRTAGHRVEAQRGGWLADLYEARADRFFAALNGVFSGLLVDGRRRQVSLFNDRYGMDRLYYHERDDAFFFASEAKALLRILPELRAFDQDGLTDFLRYGCTLKWNTLFRGVKVLPAASVWTFAGDTCKRRSYFDPATWERQATDNAEAFQLDFEETLTRVLPRYLSTEEIGISLTGGLDTRMMMTCGRSLPARVTSYTFAGPHGDTVDVRLARRVAAACRIPHHVIRITDDWFSRFESFADRTVYLTDGCVGVCGAHEIHLNEQARALTPVRVTGNFGSEILRAMTTFKALGLSPDLFDPELYRRLSAETHPSRRNAHPVSAAAFEEIPWSLFGVGRAAQSQVIVRMPYLDNDIVALAFRAPDELRRSSRPALRLVRRLGGGLERIPTDRGQLSASWSGLINAVYYRASFRVDYWLNDGMPHWLCSVDPFLSRLDAHSYLRPHRYLHYRQWFQRELASYVRERVSDPQIRQSHFWNRRFLDDMAESHVAGRKNRVREINAVLTLEAIDRLLLHSTAGFR
jgi:asparagine synthase (glutamine-hydrolysing)